MNNNPGSSSAEISRDRRHAASRERVLRALETRGRLSTSALAEATGLHENTVRGHLERLQADGFVRRTTAVAQGRGRPAIEWAATRIEDREPYAGLAVVLADALARAAESASGDVRQATHDAGVMWGERLAATQGEVSTVAQTRDLVHRVMRDQGFAPEVVSPDGDHVALHACPLLAAARDHNQVVCLAHAAMVEGIVRSAGAPVHVELLPFTAPTTCSLMLRASA